MLIFSIISCLSIAIYLILGISVILRNPESPLYRNFAYFCFCFAFWAFTSFYLSLSENPPHKILFIKLEYTAATTYEIFVLRFFIFLTGIIKLQRHRRLVLGLSLIIPFLFAYQNWFHNAIYNSFPGGFWYGGLHVFANSYNLISIILLLYWARNTSLNRVRKQAKIIVQSGLLTIGITIAGDYIAGYIQVPTPTPALTLLWIAALYYAIRKYRMLTLSPYSLTLEILNSIDDIIVLFNPDGSLSWLNTTDDPGFSKLISEKADLHDLFGQHRQTGRLVEDLIKDVRAIVTFRFPMRVEQKVTLYDVELKLVKDSFDDKMGYLMTARRIRSIYSLQTFYKLTKREMEVIQLLVTGMTYSDMSSELGITENTLKSHITNCYNKLGINNKVELINVVNHIETGNIRK